VQDTYTMKVIKSERFLNFISWTMKVDAIALFPFIIVRNINDITIRHESIHIQQQKELLIIGFYICYLMEWFIRLFKKGNAYYNISFEREAYKNQYKKDYLKDRKRFNFIKYL
jgi:hypothetical protein